jgi:hypothetical protein
MKITALEESPDFATLHTEKFVSKLNSHELSCKCCPNHDASLTSKALITSAHVGGYDANPTNIVSSALEFTLSSLAAASDGQYDNIPNDEIALLAKKLCAFHKFCKEGRRSPRDYFKYGDTTYFITDCPKRIELDSSNNYDYTNWNDSSKKGDNKKKYHFGDKKKKKKFLKMMSQAYVALSDFDFSSYDSSSSEEDDEVKRKQGDFTGIDLMGKSLRNISSSDSNVSEDLSFESLSLRAAKLENVLCN